MSCLCGLLEEARARRLQPNDSGNLHLGLRRPGLQGQAAVP